MPLVLQYKHAKKKDPDGTFRALFPTRVGGLALEAAWKACRDKGLGAVQAADVSTVRLGTYLDRFALKSSGDSYKYQPDWSSSVRFCDFVAFEHICPYLWVFESGLANIDLFVQSRLKPAWRASRTKNLLKIDLCVQSSFKLAWHASRAENLVKLNLSPLFSR